MRYAKEFNYEDYAVPAFLNTGNWEDVSWHNDICPRWENKELGIAIWVDCIVPEAREFEDWKQYTVVGIKLRQNDTPELDDDSLFETDDSIALEAWVNLHATKLCLEEALDLVEGQQSPIRDLSSAITIALEKLAAMVKLLE